MTGLHLPPGTAPLDPNRDLDVCRITTVSPLPADRRRAAYTLWGIIDLRSDADYAGPFIDERSATTWLRMLRLEVRPGEVNGMRAALLTAARVLHTDALTDATHRAPAVGEERDRFLLDAALNILYADDSAPATLLLSRRLRAIDHQPSPDRALENVRALVADLSNPVVAGRPMVSGALRHTSPSIVALADVGDLTGRYAFELTDGRRRSAILMPGVPLGDVRDLDAPDQGIERCHQALLGTVPLVWPALVRHLRALFTDTPPRRGGHPKRHLIATPDGTFTPAAPRHLTAAA